MTIMTPETFRQIFQQQIDLCDDIMGAKATEYAPKDRLANFRTTAALKHETLAQALAGMMAKHTVSIYDMIEDGRDHPLDVWLEKITDHINYLILLRAIVTEPYISPDRTLPSDNHHAMENSDA